MKIYIVVGKLHHGDGDSFWVHSAYTQEQEAIMAQARAQHAEIIECPSYLSSIILPPLPTAPSSDESIWQAHFEAIRPTSKYSNLHIFNINETTLMLRGRQY